MTVSCKNLWIPFWVSCVYSLKIWVVLTQIFGTNFWVSRIYFLKLYRIDTNFQYVPIFFRE